MSLAKISPAFDQFMENFILYELTKDQLETSYDNKVRKFENFSSTECPLIKGPDSLLTKDLTK